MQPPVKIITNDFSFTYYFGSYNHDENKHNWLGILTC